MPRYGLNRYGSGKRKKSKSRNFGSKRKPMKFKKFKAKRHAKARSKLSVAKQMAAILPDQVYLDTYSDYVRVVGTTNAKAVQTMWCTQQDASNRTTSVQRPPLNLCPHDVSIVQQILFQQAQYRTAALTTLEPVGGVPTAQVLVKSWSVQAQITNLETGPIEFEHYRCRARRDMGDDANQLPEGVLTQGFTDTSVLTPAQTPTGVTNQVLYSTYGATPFMNPRFTANVEVMKVKQYRLLPGKTIRLKYNQKNARLWKNEDFNFGSAPDGDGSNDPNRSVLRGQHFSVFVMRGTYATNIAGADANYEKGVGNASVGILYQHKIHYATITPQVMQTSANIAVPGFATCFYPLPIVANQPYSAISTGPVPAAAGTRQYSDQTIQDSTQIQ